MERAVPQVISEKIELYLRTYYSLLRSTTPVKIRSLEEVHGGMNSLLHQNARSQNLDMSAFIYSLLRLPSEIEQTDLVIMGQRSKMFAQKGIGNLNDWQEVSAPARRRRCFFDGENRIACLIASRSDIDDIIALLTAYQIERNKFHVLLQKVPNLENTLSNWDQPESRKSFCQHLEFENEDLERLETIWGENFLANIRWVARGKVRISVQLLSGSLTNYRRAIFDWWEGIEEVGPEIVDKPLYFISSNSHSMVNLLTGFALQHQDELVNFIEHGEDDYLKEEWAGIQNQEIPSSQENFFYYVLKKYLQHPDGQKLNQSFKKREEECGILKIDSQQSFNIKAQIFPLSKLNPEIIDPRLRKSYGKWIQNSDAVLLNIDYPLGMAAYHLLSEVAEHVENIRGIYIMGKAATLNGVVGDVMIPNVVYDGQSHNSYLFSNAFSAEKVAPYLHYGTVMDNQKAVTVRGTFLQNHEYMSVFYREGYTDIEMEAGPYLSAIYEMVRPKRHPFDEIVNLMNLPFDLGILHYASDQPISKGKNLGSASLSYFGMDPSYATMVAIIKRIFEIENNYQ